MGGCIGHRRGAVGGLAVVVGVVARESSGERRRRGAEVWVWVHSKRPLAAVKAARGLGWCLYYLGQVSRAKVPVGVKSGV